jgi:AraC-like DNA-binding protein
MAVTDAAREPDAQRTGPISESAVARPAEGLRRFIAYYSGYRQAGVPPATHAGLPSPYLTVIFTLDEPLTVAAHPDPAQPGDTYQALIGGLHSAPALITHEGYQSGIQLALSPFAARVFFGIPASELASIDVEASEVCGLLASEILERVRAATTWPARFAVLDEVFLRCARPSERDRERDFSAEIGFAWRRLLDSRGTIGMSALASETGWSDRYLRSRFGAEIGLTPKAAARVIRFDRARRLLQLRAESGRPLALAALAAHCGYYDQAHLDAEFRSLAGAPPTTWLAREFRNLQVNAVTAARS